MSQKRANQEKILEKNPGSFTSESAEKGKGGKLLTRADIRMGPRTFGASKFGKNGPDGGAKKSQSCEVAVTHVPGEDIEKLELKEDRSDIQTDREKLLGKPNKTSLQGGQKKQKKTAAAIRWTENMNTGLNTLRKRSAQGGTKALGVEICSKKRGVLDGKTLGREAGHRLPGQVKKNSAQKRGCQWSSVPLGGISPKKARTF